MIWKLIRNRKVADSLLLGTPIGTLIDKNFSDFGSTWTTDAGGFTVSNGTDLVITSSGSTAVYTGAFDPYNTLGYTCLEKWKMVIDFIAPNKGASSFGIQIGIKSYNSTQSQHWYLKFYMDTTNGGKLGFIAATTEAFVTPTGISYTTGDVMRLTMERNKVDMIGTIENVTQGTTLTHTQSAVLNYPSSFSGHNTGRFAIVNNAGNGVRLKNIQITSEAKKDIKTLCVGDSITYGLHSTATSQRWAELLQAESENTIEVNAGAGDKTREVLLRINELVYIKPKYILLNIGGNDIAASITQVNRESNYNSIISQLEAAGITVILLYATPRNSVDMTGWNAFLESLPNKAIDIWTPLKGTGTGLNPSYNPGDGIHLNLAAQTVWKDQVVAFAPEVI